MDSVTRAVLLSWELRPGLAIFLVLLGALYVAGWLRLRRITGERARREQSRQALSAVWRPISYVAGLVVVAVALMSPIDVMAQQLFFMHMIQHLLLIMIAPPLLLLPNPMPFLLWGLPAGVRRPVGDWLGRLLNRRSATGRLIRKLTGPSVVLLFFVVAIVGWHDPDMYNAALRSQFVHDLEHVAFFAAGMLFWWTVIPAGPHIHKPLNPIFRIVFVLAAVPVNMALGVIIAFSNEVIYTYYSDVPRLWGISVLDDQRLSGIIMWIPGSMMYLIGALILIAGLLKGESAKPAQSNPPWVAEGEALAAPGATLSGGRR